MSLAEIEREQEKQVRERRQALSAVHVAKIVGSARMGLTCTRTNGTVRQFHRVLPVVKPTVVPMRVRWKITDDSFTERP